MTLPVPAQAVFEIPQGLRRVMSEIDLNARRGEQAGTSPREARARSAPARASASPHPARGKAYIANRHGRDARRGKAKVAGRAGAPAATSHRPPQVKRRNV
jgi:hypothetical protein